MWGRLGGLGRSGGLGSGGGLTISWRGMNELLQLRVGVEGSGGELGGEEGGEGGREGGERPGGTSWRLAAGAAGEAACGRAVCDGVGE